MTVPDRAISSGPNCGIDIIAGRRVLPLDCPTSVEVKPGGRPVRRWHRKRYWPAWGGICKALKSNELRLTHSMTPMSSMPFSNYDRLDGDIRSHLQLSAQISPRRQTADDISSRLTVDGRDARETRHSRKRK
jgi:hypothetical protein